MLIKPDLKKGNSMLPPIKIKLLFEDATNPQRAYETDSGVDLYAYRFEKIFVVENDKEVPVEVQVKNSVAINPGQRVLVNTGISSTVGKGYELQIRPRSGLALKKGLTVCNTPGTIDESYRGPICVILLNTSNVPQIISKGERIAQMVACPVCLCPIVVVEDLEETERSSGGFGSTGD